MEPFAWAKLLCVMDLNLIIMQPHFTHIHSDHLNDSFGSCLHQYPIYVSKITAELIEAVMEDTYHGRTQFQMVDYDSPQHIRFNDHVDYITLIESSHMLGSSQVMLTTHDKIKILYSGDISPDDEPPECDVLILDSTHGSPRLDKKIDPISSKERFREAVAEQIVNQKPVCIHAHQGELQHLMHILSEHRDISHDVPFLACRIAINIASVYKKYGFKMRDVIDADIYEGKEITFKDYPWIDFSTSMSKTAMEREGRVTSIFVRGSFGRVVMSENGRGLLDSLKRSCTIYGHSGVCKKSTTASGCYRWIPYSLWTRTSRGNYFQFWNYDKIYAR